MQLVISGVGVTSPVGQGKKAFRESLLQGVNAFEFMTREGRQHINSKFIGAEIKNIVLPAMPSALQRTVSYSAAVALTTVSEAWQDANLATVDPERIGLVAGGSNFQQREIINMQDKFRQRYDFLRPSYCQMFMDTDLTALCSEFFGIKGTVFTVGGASASGHLAVIQAIQTVLSGQVDVCIALGTLMDLSYWECQGFRAIGAMGSDRFFDDPGSACRPFDRQHDGFIFGENCGAVVIEKNNSRVLEPYASINGWSYNSDGHRSPNPILEGEVKAIKTAIAMSPFSSKDIDYVNPHGTGSPIGDEVELHALKNAGLSDAYINATKSIVGHGLSAAGVVEVIATLIQMQAGQLHPTLNLEEPIDPSFQWVSNSKKSHQIKNALNLSFGFGGINSAICLSKIN